MPVREKPTLLSSTELAENFGKKVTNNHKLAMNQQTANINRATGAINCKEYTARGCTTKLYGPRAGKLVVKAFWKTSESQLTLQIALPACKKHVKTHNRQQDESYQRKIGQARSR